MTDLTPLKNWCTNIGLLLKQKNQKATDPRNAFNSMLGNVERELKLVEDLAANDKNKKIRVVAELPRYQQRVDHLVKTTGEVALKKLSEDAARKAIEDATRQLTQLHNSIRLARSYADPKLLDEPAIQTLRKESAKMQPVYEDKRGRIEKVIKELTEAGPGAEVQIRELQERLDRAVLLEPDYKGAYKALEGLTSREKSGRKAVEGFDGKVPDKGYKTQMQAALRAIQAFQAGYGPGPGNEVARWHKTLSEQRVMVKGLLKGDKAFAGVEITLKGVADDAINKLKTLNQLKPTAENALKALDLALKALEQVAPITTSSKHLQERQRLANQVSNLQISQALVDELDKALEEVKKQKTACDKDKTDYEDKVKTLKLAERLEKIQHFKELGSAQKQALSLANRLLLDVKGEADRLVKAREFKQASALWAQHEGSLTLLDEWAGKWATLSKEDRLKAADLEIDKVDDLALRMGTKLSLLAAQVHGKQSLLTEQVTLFQDHGKTMDPEQIKTLKALQMRLETLRSKVELARSAIAPLSSETPDQQEQRVEEQFAQLKTELAPGLDEDVQKLLDELKKQGPSPTEINDKLAARRLQGFWQGCGRQVATLRDRYQEALDALDPSDPEHPKLKKKIDELQSLPETIYGGLDKLAQLTESEIKIRNGEFSQALTRANSELVAWQKKARESLKALRTTGKLEEVHQAGEQALKGLRTQLGQMSKPKEPKGKGKGKGKGQGEDEAPMRMPWADYGETLMLELKAAKAMAESTDRKTAEEGLKLLAELKTKLDGLAEVKPGAKGSVLALEFEAVEAELEKLKAQLSKTGSPALNEFRPDLAGRYTGEFKTGLIPQLKGLSPAEARKLIADMSARVTEDNKAAQLIETRYNTLFGTGQGKELSDELNELRTLYASTHGKLIDQLQKRLDAAKANKSARPDALELEVRDMLTLVRSLKDNVKLRDTLEIRAGQEHNQEEEAKSLAPERFQSAREVFDKHQRREASQLFKRLDRHERNASLYGQIKVHLKAADSAAKEAAKLTDLDKRKAQYDTATRSLDLAREAARMFIANPLNGLAASRKSLGQAGKRWKLAVADFCSDVDKLHQRTTDLIDGHMDSNSERLKETQTRWRTVLDPLIEAKRLFDAGAFDEAIETLSAAPKKGDGGALATRRGQKEAAMVELTRFERSLSHPVIDLLRSKPPVPVRFDPLPAALLDMRKALLTS